MPSTCLRISLSDQTLCLFDAGQLQLEFAVSTALNGSGQLQGSECTPLGKHRVRAKIGAGEAINSVFVARRPTQEIYSPELAARFPHRDWILTRILWLCGSEPGFNRFGKVDSMRRYIYIHGTPDTEPMGTAKSHGCIRMRNQDVISLFDRVSIGTTVIIAP